MTIEYLARAALLDPMCDPVAAALAADALAGDPVGRLAFGDWTQENESVRDYPFAVGDKVFFHQLTLYFLGEVVEVGRGWVRLKDAHWVHWTGRLGSLFATCDLRATHGRRRPRTEYLGEYVVWLQAGVGCKIWRGEIPLESMA